MTESDVQTQLERLRARVAELERAEEERNRARAALEHEREKLRELVAMLSAAEERERQRLATHLHDDVTQLLAVGRFKLDMLAEEVGEAHKGAFAELRDLFRRAVEATRHLTVELSPPILHQLGLEPALAWLADQYEVNHAFDVSFASNCEQTKSSSATELLLFSTTRELLHNVLKHVGPGSKARIELNQLSGNLLLSVTDDGPGLDVSALPTTDGYGLFGIRQRVEPLGGRVIIESEPGQGTRVTIALPASRA